MYCLNCNKELVDHQKKFCSSACAATYNNTGRIRTKASKEKTANKLRGFYEKNPGLRQRITEKIKLTCSKRIHEQTRNCTFCGKKFISIRNDETNYYPRLCSDLCLLESNRRCARGNKNIIYKGLRFDSNWELDIAVYLDTKNIVWEQPTIPIIWIDSTGKQRKYFPDFYLPVYNLYLDPKNPIVIKQQQEKLDKVSKIIPLVYGHIHLIKSKIDQLA